MQHANSQLKEASLGRQFLVDFYDCKSGSLDDLEWVENVALEAADCAGGSIVDVVFHRLKPQGISGVILIPESHLSVRTWPHHHYAAVDIFSRNGTFDSEAAIAQLNVRFLAGKRSVVAVERGKASELIGYDPGERGGAGDDMPRKSPVQF